jgi:hypothetical protein
MTRALACLLLAGCDKVFGVPFEGHDASPDGTSAPHDGASSPDATQLPSQIVFNFGADSVCVGKLAGGGVFLLNPPAATVTVTVTSSNTAQLAINQPQVFTFTAADWNLARTVVARGVAASTSPVTLTATSPNDNPVTDTLTVTPPC